LLLFSQTSQAGRGGNAFAIVSRQRKKLEYPILDRKLVNVDGNQLFRNSYVENPEINQPGQP